MLELCGGVILFDVVRDEVEGGKTRGSPTFQFFKAFFDIFVSMSLLPVCLFVASLLLVLNRRFNPGPLVFEQERMGRRCKPFTAYKFRSMLPAQLIERQAGDPVEQDRITKLGRFLRRSRLDELPQIFNVLRGEMSLIGPRPDYFPHAQEFLTSVPGYRARHDVRPGISGLAQTEVGYAQGPIETRRKVLADLYYIKNAGFLLEAWIVWRTFCTIFGRKGL